LRLLFFKSYKLDIFQEVS